MVSYHKSNSSQSHPPSVFEQQNQIHTDGQEQEQVATPDQQEEQGVAITDQEEELAAPTDQVGKQEDEGETTANKVLGKEDEERTEDSEEKTREKYVLGIGSLP